MQENEQKTEKLASTNGGGVPLKLGNPIGANKVIMSDERTLDDYVNKKTDNNIIVIGGHKVAFMPFKSTQSYAVSDDRGTAWIKLNVGADKKGMRAVVTAVAHPNTPYLQIKNVVSSAVTEDGFLPIEVYGVGFVPEHTFVFSIILFY